MDIKKFSSFAHFLIRRFNEERCLQVAGSLSFTTLLSLVPILTIALTLVSAFPVFSGMTAHVKAFIFSNLVPESGAKILSIYVTEFSRNAARLTALGIVFLALTAFTLMFTIDHEFNTIWRVSRRRSMIHRVLIYWGMLTIGPILIGGSLSITSWLFSRSAEFVHSPHELGILFLKIVPFLLTVLAMSLLYLIVPNAEVSRFHALTGGTIAGTAFEAMKGGFGWYITHFTTYTLIYGAFSSVPVFLLWIYFSWLIMLSGALLTASLPLYEQASWHMKAFRGKRFYDALTILGRLQAASTIGHAESIEKLHFELELDRDVVQSILSDLSKKSFVKETMEGEWLLAMNPEAIRLSDIYRLTVFDPAEPLPGRLNKEISESLDSALGLSLDAFIKRNGIIRK